MLQSRSFLNDKFLKRFTMSAAAKTFASLFSKINNTIEFDKNWKNGTGYLDGAVYDVKLASGERAKTTDDLGRNVIFVGTELGTFVMFERYSHEQDGTRSSVIVANAPRALRHFACGPMREDMIHMVANDIANIGHITADIRSAKTIEQEELELAL